MSHEQVRGRVVSPVAYVLLRQLDDQQGDAAVAPVPGEKADLLPFPVVDIAGFHLAECLRSPAARAVLDVIDVDSPDVLDTACDRAETGDMTLASTLYVASCTRKNRGSGGHEEKLHPGGIAIKHPAGVS